MFNFIARRIFLLLCGVAGFSFCSLAQAQDFPETKKPRTDLFGDPLPPGSVARMGTVRFRHHDIILCLAFSPDGKTVASAGGWRNSNPEQVIRLWDVESGKEIRQLVGHTGFPGRIVFSPDGKILASAAGMSNEGYDDTIILWEVGTGKKLHVILGHVDRKKSGSLVPGLAISPDSSVLASTGRDGKIRLWDVTTGKEIRSWIDLSPAGTLAFSPTGKVLASTAGEVIQIWEVSTGKPIKKINVGPAKEKNLESVFFTPNSKDIILAGSDLHWWDWENGMQIRTIDGEFLGRSANAKFMAVRAGKQISVWDCVQGKELHRFPSQGYFAWRSPIIGFSGGLSNDGRFLVASDWHAIRSVDTQTGKFLHKGPAQWTGVVFVGFFSDDSRLISAADLLVRSWEVPTGREIDILKGHSFFISSASMSKSGKMLATGSLDGTIRVWDLGSGQELRRFLIDRSHPLVAFSPDEKVLATKLLYGGGERTFRIWDIASGKEVRRFGRGNSGKALVFLPDNQTLIDADCFITLIDSTNGKERQFEKMRYHDPSGLVLSADGRIAVTGYPDSPDSNDSRAVALWEIASGSLIAQFPGHKAGIESLALSPDGKWLATGSFLPAIRSLVLPATGAASFRLLFPTMGAFLPRADRTPAFLFGM